MGTWNNKQNFKHMKIKLTALLILMAGMLWAQEKLPVDPETGRIQYREVVEQDGTKQQLFNRCVYWLNDFYKDPVRVTSLRDVETGKIVGKHQFRIYYTDKDGNKIAAGMIGYDFTIELKQDRYRYTLNNFLFKSTTRQPVAKWMNKSDPAYDIRWNEYLDQVDKYAQDWIASLKEKMKPEPEKKPDEW
ncbi:MAG: hypothetical protein DRI88_02525 [Bacteroidetes bacterium]|nr:MAG: hypothetical protein DRI88_02525 [Bacteroidota bacterium]